MAEWEKAPVVGGTGGSAPAAGWQAAPVVGEPEEPGGNILANVFAGTGRGIIGAPVDLANAALSLVGLDSERPIMGSEWLKETMPSMFGADADTMGQRMAGRVGEEIGATISFGGPLLALAKRLSPAAVQGAKLAPQGFLGNMLAGIAAKPGRAALTELGIGTTAGLGAGVAREMAPGDPLAEAAGQFVGGMAPSLMPVGIALRGVNKALSSLSNKAQTQRGVDAVSDALQRQLTPEVEGQIGIADRLRRMMPGFNPSLGEATGSPALLNMQKMVERGAAGADLDALTTRKLASDGAVEAYRGGAGPAGGDPTVYIDGATGRVDRIREGIAEATEGVAQRQQALAGALPQADLTALGQTLRERLTEVRDSARTAMTRLAEQMGLNNLDVTVPFRDVARRLADNFAPGSIFDDPANAPPVLRSIQEAAESGAPVTFADLRALRERVSDDLIDAIGGANPSRKLVRQLTLLRGQIDEAIDQLARGTDDPTFGPRYADFRRRYFEEVIEPFERSAAFKVRARDARGFFKTTDEKVADAFLGSGDETAARQFHQIFGDDPQARASLFAAALDSLRTRAVRNGLIEQTGLDAWRRQHEGLLRVFPQLRGVVDNIATANGALTQRLAQLGRRQQALEKMRLVKVLDQVRSGERSPGDVIKLAMGSPKQFGRLFALVRRDPDALAAFRRELWDQVTAGGSQDMAAKAEQLGAGLRLVFEPDHLRAMRDIIAARTMTERAGLPGGTAEYPKPMGALERILGQGLPQLSSRVFAFKAGRMQKGYLVTETLLRGLRGRAGTAAEETLMKALYDPDVARELAFAVRAGQLSQAQRARLRTAFARIGLTLADDEARPAPLPPPQ